MTRKRSKEESEAWMRQRQEDKRRKDALAREGRLAEERQRRRHEMTVVRKPPATAMMLNRIELPQKFFTVQETASLLRCSDQFVRDKFQDIATVILGRRRKFLISDRDIARFLDENRVKPPQQMGGIG